MLRQLFGTAEFPCTQLEWAAVQRMLAACRRKRTSRLAVPAVDAAFDYGQAKKASQYSLQHEQREGLGRVGEQQGHLVQPISS